MKYKVSPSRIGDYFAHSCDRFLIYNGLTNTDRESIGWDKEEDFNYVAKKAGEAWEKDVLKLLEGQGEYIAYVSDIDEKKSKEENDRIRRTETIGFLRDARPGYIYQAVLYLTDSFKREYIPDVDMSRVVWNSSMSDLIRIEIDPQRNIPVFSVIDIKHAKRAKINHKIQIAVYADMLGTILRENNIPGEVNIKVGYVWPFRAEKPSPFNLNEIRAFLQEFYTDILPGAVNDLACACGEESGAAVGERLDGSLMHCLTEKCEWCGNMKHCVKWAEEHEPVLLIPHMTGRTQEYLLSNPEIPKTSEEFLDYIHVEENRVRICEESGFFKRRMEYLNDCLNAVSDKSNDNRERKYPKRVYSMDMPKYQDISVVLTVQKDVGLDKVYLYGIDVTAPKERNYIQLSTDQSDFPHERRVFIAKSEDELSSNTKAFVEYLYDILSKVHQHNSRFTGEQYKNKLSVQGYVMDNYELYNLEDALFTELFADHNTEVYRNKILAIVFWLQGERMITDSEIQGTDLGEDFPFVVLSSVVGKLYVIPGHISNNLEDISRAISVDFVLDSNKKYSNPLSNTLKSEPINQIWKKHREGNTAERDKALSEFEKYIQLRLGVIKSIINKIQFGDEKHAGLRRNASKFSMVSLAQGTDVRLSKLFIEHKYEQVLAFHNIRAVRMEDLELAAQEGKVLKVSVENETPDDDLKNFVKTGSKLYPENVPGFQVRYKVLNQDSFFLEPWFAAYVTDGSDKSLDELAAVNDLTEKYKRYLDSKGNPRLKDIHYFNEMIFEYEENEMYVYGARFGDTPYTPGTILYLVERFTDQAGDRTIDKISEGVQRTEILYPELRYDCIRENAAALDYDSERGDLLKYSHPEGGEIGFSESQEKAMRNLFEKNITLLLGPPGSGKTDFIARAVLTLCGYYKEKFGKKLSVLVTANSHAAINNILEKIAEKEMQTNLDAAFLPKVIKLDKYDTGFSVREVNGITVYDKWYPYVTDEDGRGYYDKNPSFPVFPKYLELFCGQNTGVVKYSYETDKAFVVGGTESAIKYVRDKMGGTRSGFVYPGFDLIIIDEASQVRMGDSLIGLEWSGHGTRFLIVGDENQLSPIIQGKYEPPEGTVDFYGSVFRTYYDTAILSGTDYLYQLEDNFRMNEILDRYPGEKIYDIDIKEGDGRNGYHAFNDAIATQILTMDYNVTDRGKDGNVRNEIAFRALDPRYPLVLVKISGEKAIEKQEEEISLTTIITNLVKNHMLTEDGNLVQSDEEFWGDRDNKGVFAVISPHHEHINKLKDRISQELNMDRNCLYIGTVDKLQGQEREAVVVSYGISNIEKALSEIEFIYSLNRLNVSITRGKKKTIVILTDVLLDKPIELLDVDDANIEKGISFVCDFEKFMKKTEDDTETDYERFSDGNLQIEVMRKRCKKKR